MVIIDGRARAVGPIAGFFQPPAVIQPDGDGALRIFPLYYGVLLLLTAKCQSAPPLLSQVPLPLLNTQSNWVAFPGGVSVNCHRFEVALKVMATSFSVSL